MPAQSYLIDSATKQDAFLHNLVSKSQSKYHYKRYNGLPLRYAGGKSLAVGHVIENIPHYATRIMSPFIGGGSVEIACAKELGIAVTSYDIFDVLINYWQVQIAQPKKLANYIEKWKPNKEQYADFFISPKSVNKEHDVSRAGQHDKFTD